MILVHVVLQLGLAELVESDDDEGDKDVDKEEGKDDEKYDVEDGHLDPEPWQRPLVLVCGRHRVLQDPEGRDCSYNKDRSALFQKNDVLQSLF